MATEGKKGVLMVCLGNICRSPIAEVAFADEVRKRGEEDKWFVDSCATAGYHIGKLPEPRGRKVMEAKGLPMTHRARQLCDEDFKKFDYIFGMDHENVTDISDEKPKDSKAVIEMLGDYDPKKEGIIIDPYYDSDSKRFELCYERCVRCVNAFLDKVKQSA
ncbi:Low molecular weight phosphotyrosine protein phosphatase [Halotydeus destructor]|nr:Low molecular weight phosphotyrosine protein phosphatase [Halotydeus destructor]